MPVYQKRGPAYRHHAQGTVWNTTNPGPRGIIRMALLLALLFVIVLTLGSETVRGIVLGAVA